MELLKIDYEKISLSMNEKEKLMVFFKSLSWHGIFITSYSFLGLIFVNGTQMLTNLDIIVV